MLKKSASGVLAILPCSRTERTLRASKWLRPCWTDFFEHSLPLMRAGLPGASMGHGPELFNRHILRICAVFAPCQTRVSTPQNGKLFLREPLQSSRVSPSIPRSAFSRNHLPIVYHLTLQGLSCHHEDWFYHTKFQHFP